METNGLVFDLTIHSFGVLLDNTKLGFIRTIWKKLHIGDRLIEVWDFMIQ
jgi:hypothetical protein